MSRSQARLPRWKIRLFGTLFVTGLILGAVRILDQPGPGISFLPEAHENDDLSKVDALKFSVYRVLFDFGIQVDWISGDSRAKTVRIPRDLAPVVPYAALVSRFRQLGGQLLAASSDPSGERMFLRVGLENKPLFELTLVYDPDLTRTSGKIALVIDDFGYFNDSVVRGFENLEQDITFSIIPGEARSVAIAKAASARNREILIHLPMEPQNGGFRPNGYMILTGMSADEIRSRVRKAIRAVPNAEGLNNHMGSKATVDEPLLKTLMQELKKAGLFFIDSRTNARSLAFSWARKMKIPCGKSQTFLDSIEEEPFIRQQLYYLAELSAKNGHAIGIGHPRKLTLKVLRDELPKLEKKGFKFVSISEVVK